MAEEEFEVKNNGSRLAEREKGSRKWHLCIVFSESADRHLCYFCYTLERALSASESKHRDIIAGSRYNRGNLDGMSK